MKFIKQILFVSAVAVFCLALQPQKAFGQELLSYDSYVKTLMDKDVLSDIRIGAVKPERAGAKVLKTHNGESQYLNFAIEKVVNGEYKIRQGKDIDLKIKARNAFADRVKYEATGNIFRQEIEFMDPLIIEKDVFGSQQILTVNGVGMDLSLERIIGFDRMEVSLATRGLNPETAVVLLGMVEVLPNLRFSRGGASNKAKLADKSAKGNCSFRLQRTGSMIYADGAGMRLSIQSRKIGRDDTEYEITGSAFGMEFGFRDFIIRTDKSFLGTGGYRVQAPGIDLEIRRNNFASEELKIRGYAGRSAEMILFILSFSQYVLAN